MYHLLEGLFREIVQLDLESERMLYDGFVRRVVELPEIGVLEGVLHVHAAVRVEGEQPVQQVESQGLGLGVELGPGDLRALGEALQVGSSLFVENAVEVVSGWGPHDTKDEVELIQVVLPREEGPVREHLAQDAPHGPHVDAGVVGLGTEHDLRRAVPPRGHVLGEDPIVVVSRVHHSRQSEVANL